MIGLLKSGAAVVGALVAVLAVVLLLASAAHFIPRHAVANHLRASQPFMDTFKRADSFTECLILGTALLSPGYEKDVLGFEKFAKVDEPCPVLKEYLGSKHHEKIKTQAYTRYWNGSAVLARAMLSVMDYLPAYGVYAVLSLGAFVLWAVALVSAGVKRNLAIASALLVLWGGGFVFFGGNLAHAPAFFFPLYMIGGFTLATRWWKSRASSVFLAVSLGALTLWFDMLFEAVPFNALLLGLTWLLIAKEPALRRLIILLVAFGIGVSAMMGLKIAAVAYFSGASAIHTEYFSALQNRMAWTGQGAPQISYSDLVLNHLPKAAEKIFIVLPVYWLYVGAGMLAFMVARVKNRANLLGYALLILIVPVWYLLFPEHSWVHSGFAARLLFWPAALGLIALAKGDKAFKMNE